jgi:transcriptional antiterminator NusG
MLLSNTSLIGDPVTNIVLPMEKVYKVRSGKKYVTEKNFFPGYLLVESSINGEVQHVVEGAPEVMHFLKDGKKATPLRQIEVERILGRIDAIKEETEFDIPYIPTKGYNPKIFYNNFHEYRNNIYNLAMYYAANGGNITIVK